MDITNREWAFAILVVIVILYCFCNAQCRPTTLQLFRSALKLKLVLLYMLFMAYLSSCIYTLYRLNFWSFENFKTTIVWMLSSIFVSLTAATRNKTYKTFIKNTARSSLGFPVIIPFIANYYSFNIVVEIVLSILFILLVLSQHIIEQSDIKGPIGPLVSLLLLLATGAIITYSTFNIYLNFDTFSTKHTAIEFALPIILSLLFIPFTIALTVLFAYESRFVIIKHFVADKSLHLYALSAAFIAFRFDLEQLQKWSLSVVESRPSNRTEIDNSINKFRQYHR